MQTNSLEHQWISFSIGRESYIHPIATVKEIVQYSEPSPVPGAPEDVEGILYVRGDAITLLSGRNLLNQKPESVDESARIIVLEVDDGYVGLSVDSVGRILFLEDQQLEWQAQPSSNQVVKGTARHGEDLYIMLDVAEYFESVRPQLTH